jgi:aspartyl/asparaginyl-tRNA synthetase
MYNTYDYHLTVKKLRTFFQKRNFIEVPTQSRLSILAACEDPFTISTFNYDGIVWPLPQTGQMWLEDELLKNPNWDGVYCISTSYRNEPNPIAGRHEKIFPMFEFESKGTINEMRELEKDLLKHLHFDEPINIMYDEACQKYNTSILESHHETLMEQEISPVISLEYFPERTSPFWNMKYNPELDLFNKIDVILFGQETIGSAERSTNPDEMKLFFENISNGKYAEKLFELFGEERVTAELDKFLSHNFFPRFGAGCGVTRMARALRLNGTIEA